MTPAERRSAGPLLAHAGPVRLNRLLWRGWRLLLSPLSILTAAVAGAHYAHSRARFDRPGLHDHPPPRPNFFERGTLQRETGRAEGSTNIPGERKPMIPNQSPRAEAAVVRLTEAEVERLEMLINAMQRDNSRLTVDDCVDAIFLIGLSSSQSTIEIMVQLLENRA